MFNEAALKTSFFSWQISQFEQRKCLLENDSKVYRAQSETLTEFQVSLNQSQVLVEKHEGVSFFQFNSIQFKRYIINAFGHEAPLIWMIPFDFRVLDSKGDTLDWRLKSRSQFKLYRFKVPKYCQRHESFIVGDRNKEREERFVQS